MAENIFVDKFKPNFPDSTAKITPLIRAITAGSFFYVEEQKVLANIPMLDKWDTERPDVFLKPAVLPSAIRSGSFFYAHDPIRTGIIDIPWPVTPDMRLPKHALSRAIRSGSFFMGAPPTVNRGLDILIKRGKITDPCAMAISSDGINLYIGTKTGILYQYGTLTMKLTVLKLLPGQITSISQYSTTLLYVTLAGGRIEKVTTS
jgi:hypothetical protein